MKGIVSPFFVDKSTAAAVSYRDLYVNVISLLAISCNLGMPEHRSRSLLRAFAYGGVG